jgi:hypothetical protein
MRTGIGGRDNRTITCDKRPPNPNAIRKTTRIAEKEYTEFCKTCANILIHVVSAERANKPVVNAKIIIREYFMVDDR